MHIDVGDVLNKLLLAQEIEAAAEAVRQLAPGEKADLPVIKIHVHGMALELGPIPVKRVG